MHLKSCDSTDAISILRCIEWVLGIFASSYSSVALNLSGNWSNTAAICWYTKPRFFVVDASTCFSFLISVALLHVWLHPS